MALQRPALARSGPTAGAPRRGSGLARDSRDVLFLLAVIAWTVMPHASRLPAWCLAMTAAALIWRGLLAWREGPLPSRPFLVFVLLLACGLTWWSHRTLLGQEAGVTMVVALTALKTLELRARRDAFVVFFLGFFLILTQFLYSQSLLTAVAMLVAVWGLLTALVLANLPVGRPALAQAAAAAARIAALGTPIMIVLFLLFPRLPPLWGQPEGALARTGLSGQMELGQVAEMALDDSIAMRVRFLGGERPRPSQLYFRGPVLSQFDGNIWRQGGDGPWLRQASGPQAPIRVQGRALDYELTLEPSRQKLLPLPEATVDTPEISGSVGTLELRQHELQWQTTQPITERLRVLGQAWLAYSQGPQLAHPALREFVELPAARNPRTLAWAMELRRRPDLAQADADTLSRWLLDHIRNQGFRYTLSPGTYGSDAIDEFWFQRRAGFCEHFAAAYVVLMRALDVPARVVTGYQGGELNPVDGYWVVRNSDAHAWAEYWQAGRGWVRVDPTSAVAPERIERGSRLRPPAGIVGGTLTVIDPDVGRQLRDIWDAVNNGWNQWVLNYSQGRQLEALRKLGLEGPDWTDVARALVIALTNLSLAAAVWAWWERRRFDPWLQAYARVRAVLERAGIDVPPHRPPLSLARQLRQQCGRAAWPLAEALERLDQMRYGADRAGRPRHPSRGERRRLLLAAHALVRALRARATVRQ